METSQEIKKQTGIDIWEYFPDSGESVTHCIERVNLYFEVKKCPYRVDVLKMLIEERKNLSGIGLDYYENRYNQILKESKL
jgi:hypothetical protein